MSGETILVVEDNPINLELIQHILIKSGYSVHTATEVEEARNLLETINPVLIVMDIQLPGMDGLTFTRLLKANPTTQHILIVALTAYAMEGDEYKALDAGCDAYISKPIDTRVFADNIAHQIEKARAHPLS
jgi:CheY-like chemotaxis protein